MFPIEEDERGTYVFNSHDLCLLPHLPLLKPINLDSFKIEGRMKSVQYVASTVKVYREAIDTLWDQGEEAFQEKIPQWLEEMDKVSHRDYSAGFLFGKPGASSHNLESSHYVRDYDFVGVCLSDEKTGNYAVHSMEKNTVWIEQRNHFKRGEVLEVLTPQGVSWSFEVKEMWDTKGVPIEVVRHAQQKIRMAVPEEILPYSILRRAKIEKG
jgi:putative protease